jgi:hypothetical protein
MWHSSLEKMANIHDKKDKNRVAFNAHLAFSEKNVPVMMNSLRATGNEGVLYTYSWFDNKEECSISVTALDKSRTRVMIHYPPEYFDDLEHYANDLLESITAARKNNAARQLSDKTPSPSC